VDSRSELLEVVGAGRPPRSFSGLLDCWQKQADQNADDGDDDEKFNKREGFSVCGKV
jgi:hypothetical protein